jgi:hypothetical protein
MALARNAFGASKSRLPRTERFKNSANGDGAVVRIPGGPDDEYNIDII